MKMDFNITKMVEEITMQAKESQEEFIFETIYPYCENILQIKINKEELKQILLNGARKQLPNRHGLKFEEIIVEYPPKDLCIYPEYRGKPYFSIKYEENGKHHIGFGTYNPKVLSQYLNEYFMPTIIEADKEADEMEQEKPIFPCIEGALAEMYVDGKWIKGKIVKGYRFDDGVVTIEDDNGQQYWCGQDRTDLYRRYRR